MKKYTAEKDKIHNAIKCTFFGDSILIKEKHLENDNFLTLIKCRKDYTFIYKIFNENELVFATSSAEKAACAFDMIECKPEKQKGLNNV